MRTGALLGLAALAAFIYYCFVRETEPAPRELAVERPRRPRAPTGMRFPEGDPTVRH